ncbi:hypothetical protein QAD02_004087 [Eretmocerus hayati]|uniref:Uncharacterized protein n=1 Tax=Eretmocerus hayati TaxID=131215 RepID=A0ACC2NNZ5_9HYME|nr:hypothetical protein QAD02_004087 [Eretmocerus hayati]
MEVNAFPPALYVVKTTPNEPNTSSDAICTDSIAPGDGDCCLNASGSLLSDVPSVQVEKECYAFGAGRISCSDSNEESNSNSYSIGKRTLFVKEIHKEEFVPSKTVETNTGAEFILAKLFLNLNARYFMPETAQQDIVETFFCAFELCQEDFEKALFSLNLSNKSKGTLSRFQYELRTIHWMFG